MPSTSSNIEATHSSPKTPEVRAKSPTSQMRNTFNSMLIAGLGMMGAANAGEVTVKLGGSTMVDGQGKVVEIEGQKFTANDHGKGKQRNASQLLRDAVAATDPLRKERDAKFYAALSKMRPARPSVVVVEQQQQVVTPDVVVPPTPRMVEVAPNFYVAVKEQLSNTAFFDLDNTLWQWTGNCWVRNTQPIRN